MALYLDNNGSVTFSDTQVTGNHAHAGAGIENAAARVTLRNLTITGNEADGDGGGIESNGSGNFTIIDTTISGNTAENGGGIANAADGALRIEKTLIWDNRALQRTSDDTGLGGGVYSLGDAKALYENVTISGNIAQVRGGGLYVDADAPVVVTSTTIAHNSSPIASGVGGEIGSPNVPIQPSTGRHPAQHDRLRQRARTQLLLRRRLPGRQPRGRRLVLLPRHPRPQQRPQRRSRRGGRPGRVRR